MGTYAATNENIIENIYLGGGKFDKGNLDKLAAKVGYTSGVGDLVTAASAYTPTAEQLGFKNSTDFGDTVVKFGTYTYGGVERELSWYPTFVSKSDGGDVILTLWLAGTNSSNDVSMQEVSPFAANTVTTDSNGFVTATGGWNNNVATSPSNNNYATSYIRAVALNNGGTYYKGYNNDNAILNATGVTHIATSNGKNKFEMFTTGALKDYIVTPENVGWQKDANYFKNDPLWSGNANGKYPDKGNWTKDKLWLPSVYEVYDSTKGSDYNSTALNEKGGLWQTGNGASEREKRSNLAWTWLRSGYPDHYSYAFSLPGTGDYSPVNVNNEGAVRPALHLNLTKAAANSFNTIENIYDQANSKFNGANLNALAQAAKFADFKSMLQTAQDGTIKTSQDFGDTVVEFGTYTYGGVQRELTWIPAYLSEDTTGNPILTLWLAGTDSANGTLSDQEISTYSDGTYSPSATQSYNGATVYSNTYDSSYIRNYILNGSGNYAGDFGTDTAITKPAADTLTKFTQFTTGALKDYIVTPQNVSWQNNVSYMKNDAQWNASGKTTDASGGQESYPIKGTAANYPSGWLTDKIWLPSMYETYDNTINADGTRRWDFADNGGLWKISTEEKSNLAHSWLRSAYPNNCNYAYLLLDTGVYKGNIVTDICAVRPALHLNLNMAATSACDGNSHISGGEWLSDGTNHWKECTVCGAKLDSAAHSFDEGVRNPEPTCTEDGVLTKTCTVCGETKTESIGALGHTPETIPAVAPTCTETGLTEGSKCSVCQEILTPQTEVPKIPHTPEVIPAKDATCTETGLTEGSKCSVCQTVITEQTEVPALGHSWNEGEQTAAPTCTKEGVKTFTCTVCGETKTETIEKLAHTPETISAVAPTCTETGLTEGSKCSVCNTIIKAQEIVPKLDHTLGTWQHDDTNHWKLCSVCNTKQENAAHNFGAWTVIKEPTATESGERNCTCTVCGYIKTETIVQDENGNWVSGLPELPDPDSNYKLEITIKATDKVYALDGQSKGYNVRLWIVNNKTDDKKEFNKEMEVTLSLIVPHGMEDFTLYKLVDGGFEEIKPENYTVEAGVLSIRTTLPEEFIFNTAAAPVKAGVPWWVWLIVALAIVAVVIIIVIVVVKKKHAPAPETETVYVNGESYDDTELKRKVEEQNEKIDELLNREIPVDALSQTLTDDEMRSFFTDQELNDMVKQGKITREDCDRVIKGRKK